MNTHPAGHEMDDAERRRPRVGECRQGGRARRWTALLDRIATGDTDALGTFYDESSKLVFGLIMHILEDRDAAEDALVEVYTQVRTQARFNAPNRHPVSWLVALARRTALARLGTNRDAWQSRDFPALPSAAGTPVVPFEPFHGETHRIRRALDRLTPRQRSIIRMTYFGGLSGSDVAEELQIPTPQVMSEIRWAMSTLRHALSGADCD